MTSPIGPAADPVRGWAFEHYGFAEGRRTPAPATPTAATATGPARPMAGRSAAAGQLAQRGLARSLVGAVAAAVLLLTGATAAAAGAGLEADGIFDLVDLDGGPGGNGGGGNGGPGGGGGQ